MDMLAIVGWMDILPDEAVFSSCITLFLSVRFWIKHVMFPSDQDLPSLSLSYTHKNTVMYALT